MRQELWGVVIEDVQKLLNFRQGFKDKVLVEDIFIEDIFIVAKIWEFFEKIPKF